MSTRNERTDAIATLEKEFTGATGIYMTDFTRVNVEKITKFRADIRNAGAKYLVVKNTIARIALERCGFESLIQYVNGPIGVVITKDDAIVPAKVIKEFKKTNKDLMQVKIAYVDGSIFNAAETARLANLPAREVLLSQLLSCMCAPMSNFVGSLKGILTKFVGTLESVKNKKESEN